MAPAPNLLSKYNDVILAQDSGGVMSKYFFDSFNNREALYSVLWQVADGETEITKDGINFFEEFYKDLDTVAKIMCSMGGFGPGLELLEDILLWLEELKIRAAEYT